MKLIFYTIFLACSITSFGQGKKQFIGGNINGVYETNIVSWEETVLKDVTVLHLFDSRFFIHINPELGIIISKRNALGGAILYGYEHLKKDPFIVVPAMSITKKALGFSLFVRHLAIQKHHWELLFKTAINYKKTKVNDVNNTAVFQSNFVKDELSLAFIPLISYSIKENLRLNCSFGNISYSRISKWIEHVTLKKNLKNTQTDFRFNFNASNFLLGVEFRM